MNKLKIKEEKIINIEDNTSREFYFYQDSNFLYTFHLGRGAKLTVYHYIVDSSSSISVHLDGEYAEVDYHCSILNQNDHQLKFNVEHHANHTTSNIYNHGVNQKNNKLHFDICGFVSNTSKGCICNQENQIINLDHGESTILPKLLIDQYDVSSSHSAYIGKFSDEILFYFMSRGISPKMALELLVRALLMNGGGEDHIEVKKLIEKIEML